MAAEPGHSVSSLPEPYVVRRRSRETADTWTLEIVPHEGQPIDPQPGQFAMLSAFGVGEVPISLSGRGRGGSLVHTIKDVGAVSAELCRMGRGDMIGVRGPFGTEWPLDFPPGTDVLVVAGGLGMAPLRPAVEALLERRDSYGRLVLLYGARTPDDLLYREELDRWRAGGFDVQLTVDAGTPAWRDRVGVVPKLVETADFDPATAVALVCGPEVMIRFTVAALAESGISDDRLHVSLERNMRCGIGHCGHCQLGPTLVCRDGPVFSWAEIGRWLAVREL
jgi:anaerobic sulfite reductase subunit B